MIFLGQLNKEFQALLVVSGMKAKTIENASICNAIKIELSPSRSLFLAFYVKSKRELKRNENMSTKPVLSVVLFTFTC